MKQADEKSSSVGVCVCLCGWEYTLGAKQKINQLCEILKAQTQEEDLIWYIEMINYKLFNQMS